MKKILFLLFLVSFALAKNPLSVAIVAPLPLPALTAFVSDARIVFMPSASMNAYKNSLAAFFYPENLRALHSNEPSAEELLKLGADLYICPSTKPKLCAELKRAGLEVLELGFDADNYNSKSVLAYWFKNLGKYFNVKEKEEKILADISKSEDFIASKTKNQPKTRAIIIFSYEKERLVLGGLFANYLLEKSGAVNLFKGVNASAINLEELYALDPEIIYITNFTTALPEDLFVSSKWQGLKAVADKKVYKLPLATYRSFAPNLDLAVLLKFMALKNHPDLFEDLDIKAEYKRHFKQNLNLDLNEAQLEKIFNPSKEAGLMK
ncbi:hypothetical protein DMB92_02090 [Campylobacter sp. MIT 99-7217]|uniref:ABC transporter substrate-binding protein n=1 Tax=Campylobacter sp. MIT 99-7217 TaxID=535091 RepID=UPI001157AE59|nr:ABC transporter substrate-binding protein [Campylobacter sp. MIT 99-7217]TQR33700.1 hypothetical protein DMB92_02090 [Campylobacter sp. MIT 99-7217]